MSAGRADSLAEPAPSRRWIPFWVLQVAELAVAFVFVDVAVHLTSQGLLLAAAALFALLAVTARGPLGIVRLCPRGLHVVLVVVASVAIALSPILPVLRPDLIGIIVVEFGAVGMIRLATLTRTADAAPVALPPSGSTSSAPRSSAPADGPRRPGSPQEARRGALDGRQVGSNRRCRGGRRAAGRRPLPTRGRGTGPPRAARRRAIGRPRTAPRLAPGRTPELSAAAPTTTA